MAGELAKADAKQKAASPWKKRQPRGDHRLAQTQSCRRTCHVSIAGPPGGPSKSPASTTSPQPCAPPQTAPRSAETGSPFAVALLEVGRSRSGAVPRFAIDGVHRRSAVRPPRAPGHPRGRAAATLLRGAGRRFAGGGRRTRRRGGRSTRTRTPSRETKAPDAVETST
ncbi:hypothetical protein M885DRAFT_531784 [Pelagophyceae sp. CCMP2097]|nr:hypothetical protein M885DRAFT_531784 [Pelagophyceae sp. CCMP2097]